MKHMLSLFVALALVWMLWSGIYTPLLLSFEFLSCLIVLLIVWRMNGVDRETVPIHIRPNIISYWLWLLKEMILSSLHVSKLILGFGPRISPSVVRLPIPEMDEVTKVTLANSITLTPGTVTLDVSDTEILVHCLTKESADDLRSGRMLQKTMTLEK